jgi:hypothetical protein
LCKRLQLFEAERSAELSVVAELRVRVEWKMRAVNRQVVLNKETEQFATLACPRMGGGPEEPVMHQQQIGVRGDGEFHGREAGVHSRGDARDASAVFHLETIGRAVVILDFRDPQQPVAMPHDPG